MLTLAVLASSALLMSLRAYEAAYTITATSKAGMCQAGRPSAGAASWLPFIKVWLANAARFLALAVDQRAHAWVASAPR